MSLIPAKHLPAPLQTQAALLDVDAEFVPPKMKHSLHSISGVRKLRRALSCSSCDENKKNVISPPHHPHPFPDFLLSALINVAEAVHVRRELLRRGAASGSCQHFTHFNNHLKTMGRRRRVSLCCLNSRQPEKVSDGTKRCAQIK